MERSDDWKILTVTEPEMIVDLQHLLGDAVVPFRERAVDEGERFDTFVMGARTRFGAPAARSIVIEVPGAELPRARVLFERHLEELEHATEAASGVAPASAEELAADRQWIAERNRKQARAGRRLGWFFGGLIALVLGTVVFFARHPARLRSQDDPMAYLAAYGSVVPEGDGVAIDIDPTRVQLTAEKLDEMPGLLLSLAQSKPWELYIDQPSDELREWIASAAGPSPSSRTLHGHAIQLGDLAGRAPGLRAYFARALFCGRREDPTPCSDQQIDSHWVVLIDR